MTMSVGLYRSVGWFGWSVWQNLLKDEKLNFHTPIGALVLFCMTLKTIYYL